MKIMEFISNENLKKKNPFEDCQIIERVDTETYQNIINSAMVIAFNLDTNEPRTMFYDFFLFLLFLFELSISVLITSIASAIVSPLFKYSLSSCFVSLRTTASDFS